MAELYCLVCFGGRQGLYTWFDSGNDRAGAYNNWLTTGQDVVFTTTGTLPAGLTSGTVYYARYYNNDEFTIHTTKMGAINNTNRVLFTSNGSGDHYTYSSYRHNLTTEQKARYGSPGSERIYHGLAGNEGFNRQIRDYLKVNPAQEDVVVAEIGEAFTESYPYNPGIADFIARGVRIESKVNGVRSAAWHNGVPGTGYTLRLTGEAPGYVLNLNYVTLDGIEIFADNNNCYAFSCGELSCFMEVKNCIFRGNPAYSGQRGMYSLTAGFYYNNIIVELGGDGLLLAAYSGTGAVFHNNLVTKCTGTGIASAGSNRLIAYNNISVGNGTNWGLYPPYAPAPRTSHNIGAVGDKKTITTNFAVNNQLVYCTAHGFPSGKPITFRSTGTLPTSSLTGQPLVQGKTYYVSSVNTDSFTITDGYDYDTVQFTANGSGTHSTTLVWCDDGTEIYLDMSSPNNVFENFTVAPYDFRPAGTSGTPHASALQVESGMEIYNNIVPDILGNVRPNYINATTDKWDIGPFEFDHGNGLAPLQVTLAFFNMAVGSVLAVYRVSDGAELIAPITIGAGGTHSVAYSYTGDVPVTVVVRKGTSSTKYLPYSSLATITNTGISLVVNQVVDTVVI